MKTYWVLSGAGKDRPGLIHRISRSIREQGGNIEIQRSAKMAGQFATIILFSIEGQIEENADSELRTNLSSVAGIDFPVTVSMASGSQSSASPTNIAQLIAEGADHPGIVDAVTLHLFQEGLNIESLDYEVVNAPMSGTPMFRMNASFAIPSDMDIRTFRRKLSDIEEDLDIDVLLRYPVLR